MIISFFWGGGGWGEGVGLPGGLEKNLPNFFNIFLILCGFLFVFLVVPHGMQDSISQPGNQT